MNPFYPHDVMTILFCLRGSSFPGAKQHYSCYPGLKRACVCSPITLMSTNQSLCFKSVNLQKFEISGKKFLPVAGEPGGPGCPAGPCGPAGPMGPTMPRSPFTP